MLNRNFKRGGEVLEKSLQWERYGYFLELDIVAILALRIL